MEESNKYQLFYNIENHLLNDEMPSLYFEELFNQGKLQESPFLLLVELKKVEQSKLHHPEGNVWNETTYNCIK